MMHSSIHMTALRALTHHEAERPTLATPAILIRRALEGAHVETHHVVETGDIIRVSCTCALGVDHTYAQWLSLDRKTYNSRQKAAERLAAERQAS